MKKEEKKKPENYIKQINSIIDYYNNFEDSNVTIDSIVKTREELYSRIFDNKEVKSIDSDLEIQLPNNKTYKLKAYKNAEELFELLESSKDAFVFLLYEKNKKEGHVLDIVGFIILSLLGLGFIYAGKLIIGLIFIIAFISLYVVTFYNKKKDFHK